MLVAIFLVVTLVLGLASGQVALGQVCWSHEAGVIKEGCAEGTLCHPWIIGKVGLDLVFWFCIEHYSFVVKVRLFCLFSGSLGRWVPLVLLGLAPPGPGGRVWLRQQHWAVWPRPGVWGGQVQASQVPGHRRWVTGHMSLMMIIMSGRWGDHGAALLVLLEWSGGGGMSSGDNKDGLRVSLDTIKDV